MCELSCRVSVAVVNSNGTPWRPSSCVQPIGMGSCEGAMLTYICHCSGTVLI
jgi:hypothetical protein